MTEFQIGDAKIGLNHPPFIIAEMSGNHNQSLERAIAITEAVAKAGAQALKLQTYKPDILTLDSNEKEFIISDETSLWNKTSLYDLYKVAYTPWEWHEPIMKRAKELGLICFSSPFDETAVDFLETLDTPAYKIASYENIHLPLIRKAASMGKPLLISTGMATLAELDEAVRTARDAGCKHVVLLKCTSAYPAMPQDANVRTIPVLRERFDCEAGLSDHTMGIGVAVAAVAYGATLIEKHVTLSREEAGVDAAFSLNPDELKALVTETNRGWRSLGGVHFGALEVEKPSLQERRSLYVVADLKSGDVLTEHNIRCIRPAYGLAPKHYDTILGKKVTRSVKKGTPMSWEFL